MATAALVPKNVKEENDEATNMIIGEIRDESNPTADAGGGGGKGGAGGVTDNFAEGAAHETAAALDTRPFAPPLSPTMPGWRGSTTY